MRLCKAFFQPEEEKPCLVVIQPHAYEISAEFSNDGKPMQVYSCLFEFKGEQTVHDMRDGLKRRADGVYYGGQKLELLMDPDAPPDAQRSPDDAHED